MSWVRSKPFTLASSLAALAYLVLMYAAGAPPTHENRVISEIAGLLETGPAEITRIEINGAGTTATYRREHRQWTRSDGTAVESLSARIEGALGLLHRSGPIRVLRPEQTAAVAAAAYGLDPPRLRITLSGAQPNEPFEVAFGDAVSDGDARFARIAGRAETYILSGFVFNAWADLTAR